MSSRAIFEEDLSVEQYCRIMPVPHGTRSIGVDIGWPSTGTPAGTLTFEESIHGMSEGDWQEYSRGDTDEGGDPIPLTVTVAGTADVAHVRNLEITGPCSFRLHWVPSSGGTGARFYDGANAELGPLVKFSI